MSTETQHVETVQGPAETTRRYCAAVVAGDADGVAATMAAGAVMRSPISSLARFEGREAIREVLGVVLAAVSETRYVSEIVGENGERALIAQARVGGEDFEEAVWLRFDERGLISEVTLFIRPLAGLTALMAAIGPPLAARHSRARELAAAAMTRPLAALTHHGDPLAVRIAGVGHRTG